MPARRLPTILLAAVALLLTASGPARADGSEEIGTAHVRGEQVIVGTHPDERADLDRAASAMGQDQAGGGQSAEPAAGAGYLSDTWCGTERAADDTADAIHVTLPVIKVVYARPSDQPSRFATYRDVIQRQIKDISGVVAASGGSDRSLRFDLGTDCASGGAAYVDVQSIALPHTSSYYLALGPSPSGGQPSRFTAIKNDVHTIVTATGQKRNYLIYADYLGGGEGRPPFGVAGQGTMYYDDSPGAGNAANLGELNAVVFGTGAAYFSSSSASFALGVPLHEVTHNLGGVQDSAPHASEAGHCYDEYDVECYDDGGSYFTGGGNLTFGCADAGHEIYDCGNDDYFSPSPAPGSYLATHWNAYNSIFMCTLPTCGTPNQPPSAHVGADPPYAGVGAPVRFDAAGSVDPDGQIVRYEWDLDGNGTYERDTGATPSVTAAYGAAGTYSARLRVTDNASTSADDTITIQIAPSEAPASEPASATPAAAPAVVRPPAKAKKKKAVTRRKARAKRRATRKSSRRTHAVGRFAPRRGPGPLAR